MKLFTKIVAVGALAAAGATMYAAPGDDASVAAVLAQAETVMGGISANFNRVVELQALARKERDVIKLSCIDDKLVAMKPEMNIADQSLLQIRGSSTNSEAQSSLSALTASSVTIHGLADAAEQCSDTHALVTESSNDYTHPDIQDPLDYNPFGAGIWNLEPPAYASPMN